MILQQKMGTVFLAFVAVYALHGTSLTYAGQILLPQDPRPQIPPSRGEEGAREDYLRKKQHMDAIHEDQRTPPPSAELVRDKKLLEESIKPVPLNVGLTLSLLYNSVKTSGDERKNYSADPSAHIAFFYRPIKTRHSSQVNLWLGARGYFVGGTANYKGTRGRYSFSYYGPMIGVGKFDPGSLSVGRDDTVDSPKVRSEVLSRNGYFALAGLAAQTRLSTRDEGAKPPEDDLDSTSVAFDSPGIWAEIWYVHLRYNAISVQTFAGIQTGNKKQFYYFGIGVGGWR